VTNSSIKKSENKGVELRIHGIVQGVGFRPFIYNLAAQLNISGTVSNSSTGVFIQAFADRESLQSFIKRIQSDAPPLARILALEENEIDPTLSSPAGFHIVASESGHHANTAIPPDIALCGDCLNELSSPADRRYNYPFINCTNCGPRFTIIEALPYDRPKTSMRVFPMCSSCEKEYNDPADRRFHAQPNACPECGPQISWHDRCGTPIPGIDPVEAAISALIDDSIVAIRGLGGFHLAVNGCSESAVDMLRQRKIRPTKPLAIMVKDLAAVEAICSLSPAEAEELSSPRHPIVLLHARNSSKLAPNLNPGVGDIGVMLPYTPLHHLLFRHPKCPDALVMTSGNHSGRPICISNEAALGQLSEIADFFLLHNREIHTRVDDSVVKYLENDFVIFRRARGFSPEPLLISQNIAPALACGGGLKSTFCLGRDNLAFISQHIGDLFNLESYDFYLESVKHHQQVFEIEPEFCVRDLHPDYLSSHFADEQNIPVYRVQHHHAHAAAVMAEHGITEAIAIVLDGTGYGPDKTIWGGEILLSRLSDFERLGHLQYLPLPGGDKAAEEPWRMALSALYQLYGPDCLKEKYLPPLLRTVNRSQREILVDMVENGFNAPLTSSCGRLFDAIAALLDLRLRSDFEGHAAMELENLATRALRQGWRKQLDDIMAAHESSFLAPSSGKWEIISQEFVKVVVEKRTQGINISQIALDFHFELVCAVSTLVSRLATQHGTDVIVLSGGCMQNRLLMEGFYHTLQKLGLQVFTGRKVPINDGGISFGQIIIGGVQHVSRNTNEGHQSLRRPG
jgi:hydrogenase maturation protein HypF